VISLAAYLHDLDPVAVPIAGPLAIRWYGLAYLAGFAAAWLWMREMARRGVILVPKEAVGDVILGLVIGVMVGGRLGYAVFYRPSLLIDFHGSFPFWGIFEVWKGGMASHGGMIGIIVACLWMGRRMRVPGLHILDAVAAVAGVGIFFGRVANFVNGELLGKIAALPGEPAPWWSVKYPQEMLERWNESGRTLEQTIELEGLLAAHTRAGEDSLSGVVIERVIGLVQSGDQAVREQIAPLLSARHPSQLYQAFAEGLLTLAVVWLVWRKPRKPGVIMAAFFMTYGVGRVLTEFVRLPDAHLVVERWMGLSRGQWVSVVMVAAGAALWWWASRRDVEGLGGWMGARAAEGDDAGARVEGPSRAT
jgi:phosphatidylglycerol:prolipoprotein diacylglycerol transferase